MPVLLTCEHASRRLPPWVTPTAPERRALASHWGWDPGGWPLTTALARRLGACALGGRWSRLWIDLNRRADDPTLVRREAGGTVLGWNRRLTRREVERRIAAVHAPYHQEVDREIVRLLLRGVRPLILSVHTFTPVLDSVPRPFDVGVLFDRHAPAASALMARLRAGGLSVRANEPYSGRDGLMYSAERHGRHHDLVCLELEVNQARLADRRFASRLAQLLARGLTD